MALSPQLALALASTQLLPHAPQSVSVRKFVSQPVAMSLSQLP